MICYHTTDAADKILHCGFRDSTRFIGGLELTGVWLADSLMDVKEGAKGDQILRVEFGDDVALGDFELVEDGKPYREWCVPAAVIGEHAKVDLMCEFDLEEELRSRATARLDQLAQQSPEAARAIEELRQHARELTPEADSFEEFAEMFGLGSDEDAEVEEFMDLALHHCGSCGRETPEDCVVECFDDLWSLADLGWRVTVTTNDAQSGWREVVALGPGDGDPVGVIRPTCTSDGGDGDD